MKRNTSKSYSPSFKRKLTTKFHTVCNIKLLIEYNQTHEVSS